MEDNLSSDRIFEMIESNRAKLVKFEVKSLGLFGSYARNEQMEDSDIDFLVQFSHYTYRNFAGLRDFLNEIFGRKIDLICEPSLNHDIKAYIIEDVKWLVN